MSRYIYPVILCGGSGTRLWPLSRAMYPKQFIRFFAHEADSLLGATLHRLVNENFARPTLLCNNNHRFLLKDELLKSEIAPREILLEPEARNTAPAIAIAALSISDEDPNAVLAVMPSDHLIKDGAAFAARVRDAAAVASQGRLALFGIEPNEPHTGYGYIRKGAQLDGPGGGFSVAAFVEKPDAATAQRYLDDGSYYWNSGIFVLHAKTFLTELERLAPEILASARTALTKSAMDLDFRRLDAEAYSRAPNISIDYAVMEKTKLAAVLPLNAGWNDVGSWSSLWEAAPHDADGNSVRGEAILVDTKNCYVHSERALISTIGLEDLVVVDTADAVLVARRDRAQDVGKLVSQLKASKRREHEQHVRNYRPWGHFETLSVGGRFQVKLLHVKPGGKLSLQMHHHRSEHWVVVKGTALVTAGEVQKLVPENESIYIFATQWHRLENPGKVPLEIIEVQLGSYLGEDDIVRSDDIYQRAPEETK
ncbi:MAG: mannose-1-phosphate guanylyltransferase/mannose-6-phosphate isomerase [Hyphomicrobiales bacterium]|nr:mannose-1-phosphate guanylyltransferase/mannose-6-phosphate isomerase [Hyphomicrobiales bacterium]